MPFSGWHTRVGVILGLAVYLYACGTPSSVDPLPRLTGKDAPQGLIPEAYLRPSRDPKEALDPQLVQEIQAFLEKSGILFGAPSGAAREMPVVLNKPVQFYVIHFSRDKKSLFSHYLARSGRYVAKMRQILHEYGLPPDLVYLALVESGFNPWARSPAEAVGPWQFIEGTARRYGLKVNEFVDERRDPEKSTRAAARYLKDLYRQFGCWYLAAASYNAGEKRVEKTVSRLGSRDFWVMAQKNLLPRETCNYVPQFIAAALIAKNPQGYGLGEIAYQPPYRYERVKVPGGTDLRRLAEALEISYAELQDLNPELNKARVSPDETEYALKVPLHKQRAAKRLATMCWQQEDPGL